jgi:tetratricopeptide (TPR) repeat protein
MRPLTRFLFILIIPLACCQITQAEEGILVVQVSNPLGQVIPNVVLSATGDSSTSASTDVTKQITEVAGKVRIRLAGSTRPGDEVELIIVKAPQDLVFISPWNQRVTVPCFDNNTRCAAKVVLAERGSRMLLEYPPAQLALAAKVNASNAASVSKDEPVKDQRQANLTEVAKAYSYTPEEVDRAIRDLGKKTSDPFQLGQVALYERNYPEAEKQLLKSKAERRDALADVSYSLGQTYYEQGKYREAIKEYEEAAALRPGDNKILNSLGTAFYYAGQYMKSEESYQKALKIDEKALGSEHSSVANSFNGLAVLYKALGKHAEAESLLKRALAIYEKQFGPEHRDVANSLNNLGVLYRDQRKFAEAESLHKRALAIREKLFGPKHSSVATSLNDLAVVYSDQGKYIEAEPLYKRALAIYEKELGPEHPWVAAVLDNLAQLYSKQGTYAEAESQYKRALAIREKQLGLEHPDVAISLHNLAVLYSDQGKYTEAETLYKRALAIIEKQLGPDHPSVVTTLLNYADLMWRTNRAIEAENMEARARAIRAKLTQVIPKN